eukprot:6492801-Amphidinium_carterae.3
MSHVLLCSQHVSYDEASAAAWASDKQGPVKTEASAAARASDKQGPVKTEVANHATCHVLASKTLQNAHFMTWLVKTEVANHATCHVLASKTLQKHRAH